MKKWIRENRDLGFIPEGVLDNLREERTLYGADPLMEDEDGEIALDFAQSNGHAEVVQFLE